MIHSLDVALRLNAQCNVGEFFVSKDVFMDVLHTLNLADDKRVMLDRPYDSPRFRFLNKVCWRGIMFIHVSDVKLLDPFGTASRAV